MKLKKLEIHGFKSFADRVEMTFEQGITGVVGPNGCGKSNISDAVRWVLGEQSAKTLRGTKMEDVIFNGTETRRRLSYCEVVLTFDNEDRALPVDFGEVAVLRRVYRSGESEYQINKTQCRLKDVIDLFRDTGIGKEGYSLIGQGRIDEILSARSEDRRNVFEEAAGIVKYKTRKNDAERRMENTRLNLERVEDILQELNDRVEPLRIQSEIAREYLSLRDELKGLELNAFLQRSDRYQARIRELQGTVDTLYRALGERTAESDTLSAARDERENALGEAEEEAAKLREEVQSLIREVEAREGAVQLTREKIAATDRDIARLQDDQASASDGGGTLREKEKALTALVQRDRTLMEERMRALDAEEAVLRGKEQSLDDMTETSETAKAHIIEAMNRLGDVRSEEARLGAMKNALENRLTALTDDEDAGKTRLEAIAQAVADAETRLSEDGREKRELEEMVAGMVEKVKQSADETEQVNRKLQALTSQKQSISSRLTLLSEMQRDYDGYQNSVKQVLLHAKKNGISGVHGVVANLIRVPEKLERALDMVLGAALQNIVVGRDEDAKGMIEYLRRNRFGRATFLPMSSVRGRTLSRDERRVLSMPGCVGLASELIEYEPVYRDVVENLLGRTVIAENLESGIAIQRAGRYAFRLVTLDGDVMHSGGSMTGGSVQSKMTSLLSREREIGQARAQLQRIDQALDEIRGNIERIESEKALYKRERTELFDRLHAQEVTLARSEAHVNATREEQRSHEGRMARVREEAQRLTEQLAEVEESLSHLVGKKDSVESVSRQQQEEVARLQSAIAVLRSEVDEMRERTQVERVSLATFRRGLEANEAEKVRLSGQLANLQDTLSRTREELAAALEKKKQDEVRLSLDEQELSHYHAALEKEREKFQRADKMRVDIQTHIREMTARVDEIRREVDDFTDRHHKSDVQLTRMEGEFKQMNDRIWEDYELTYEGAGAFRQEDFKLGDAERRIAQIRQRVRDMGSVNVSAVDEYRQTVERVNDMTSQRDDLVKAQLDLENIIEELLRKMDVQFRTQFELLNGNFSKTFVSLFGGGRAELRLSDPKDALNCGIEIVAQPPGKKLQTLSLLSGGERALTAIAILFAMLKLKPTPFCFLDEIEAALDDANIDNFADYLKEYSENTQFVVVTHRKGTMERCNALYGVAMQEKGVSKMVSVKLSDAM